MLILLGRYSAEGWKKPGMWHNISNYLLWLHPTRLLCLSFLPCSSISCIVFFLANEKITTRSTSPFTAAHIHNLGLYKGQRVACPYYDCSSSTHLASSTPGKIFYRLGRLIKNCFPTSSIDTSLQHRRCYTTLLLKQCWPRHHRTRWIISIRWISTTNTHSV